MQSSDNLALATYGEKQDLAVVKERVSLTTYGATLSDQGRAMVAQLCWLLNWNPFFDVHAFQGKGGRIVVMPDYKKLIEIAREKERINYETRAMTPDERSEFGLKDDEVGGVCEITEVDMFLDFVKAGVGDQYKRLKGYGVWKPGDNVPSTWTPQQVANKRAIRNGLAHLVSYKMASQRLQQALMQAGAIGVEETDDGFVFDAAPAPETEPVIIDNPPADDAELKTLEHGEVVDVPTTEPEPVSTPEKAKIGKKADKPTKCTSCGLEDADPDSPYPTLCKSCGDAEANRQAKATESAN